MELNGNKINQINSRLAKLKEEYNNKKLTELVSDNYIITSFEFKYVADTMDTGYILFGTEGVINEEYFQYFHKGVIPSVEEYIDEHKKRYEGLEDIIGSVGRCHFRVLGHLRSNRMEGICDMEIRCKLLVSEEQLDNMVKYLKDVANKFINETLGIEDK